MSHSDVPLIIAGTFETVGGTEEGSVGREAAAAGNAVFTELSVATSRVHLLSPFKSLLTALHSATKSGTRLLVMALNAGAMHIWCLSERTRRFCSEVSSCHSSAC